jgi:hypothetical protein
VQILPEAQIVFHTQGGLDSPKLEAQLALVKANVGKALKIKGPVKIEASINAGTEMKIADAAVGRLSKAFESKISAELSFEIAKRVEIKPGLDVGTDGQVKPVVGVGFKF